MPENPVDELAKHDMTPERALEIVERIKGPQGIIAARKEVETQIESRKMMLVKLQAQIEAFQAFGRTLMALENIWGLKTPTSQPMPAVAESAQKPVESAPETKFDEEAKKRVVEGKCSYKAPSFEGGKWCERRLDSKLEKERGFCSIHLHFLGIVDDSGNVAPPARVEAPAKAKAKKKSKAE